MHKDVSEPVKKGFVFYRIQKIKKGRDFRTFVFSQKPKFLNPGLFYITILADLNAIMYVSRFSNAYQFEQTK